MMVFPPVLGPVMTMAVNSLTKVYIVCDSIFDQRMAKHEGVESLGSLKVEERLLVFLG